MCIIAIKPRNQEFPTMAEMENCWDANSDGFGFMYANGESVKWQKGYMTKESFKHVYQQILDASGTWKKAAFVFHFRIATHGGKGQEMTHPFPVTTHGKEILKLSGKSAHGFAHNGILTSVPSDTVYSDTANYVRMYLAKINLEDTKFVQYFLDETASGSRFALLYPSGRFLKAGVWKDHGGCFWSNEGYKEVDYSAFYRSRIDYGEFDWEKEEWTTASKALTPYQQYRQRMAALEQKDNGLTRLPEYMLVYGADGTIYRQGSTLLGEGEEFYIDTEESMLYMVDSRGDPEYVDQITDAVGNPVTLGAKV